jgi:putative transposase
MLTYKEAFYGTKVELVDRWYPSSKMCSDCGNVQFMPLSERVYRCQSCGHVQDRDENASINLENAPSDRVRRATTELTPADKKRPTSLNEVGSKRRNK